VGGTGGGEKERTQIYGLAGWGNPYCYNISVGLGETRGRGGCGEKGMEKGVFRVKTILVRGEGRAKGG